MATTYNIIRSNDLYSLILLAIQNVCCNIDSSPDNNVFSNHIVLSFNINMLRNKNAKGYKKIKDTSKYSGNYYVTGVAKIILTNIIVPSSTTYASVLHVVDQFFNNTINNIITDIIYSSLYYHISECIKLFIDDTIICCVSPYYGITRFYFDIDTTKNYTYNIDPIVSTKLIDTEIQQFYTNLSRLDSISIAFALSNNCRICLYTTQIDEL